MSTGFSASEKEEERNIALNWSFHHNRPPAYQAHSAKEFVTKIIVGLKHPDSPSGCQSLWALSKVKST
jgi:hypothetical protein